MMFDTEGGLSVMNIQHHGQSHAFRFVTPTMQEEGMTIVGDDISSIMTHHVLWLYAI